MYKIYSRPRIKIPKIIFKGKNQLKIKRTIMIIIILIIALLTAKMILDAIYPIFDTLCESKAMSIATIISNEQATNVMKEHSYDEMFTIEKDQNNNITMVKSNIVSINEIISDIAIKIQEDMNKKGKENVQIPLRKFYRF